jgi:rod shape-determining protein MreB
VEQLSPELAGDVFTSGAAMVGGGALLRGWSERLYETIGLRVRVPEEPLMCVMRGLIQILHHRDRYAELIVNSRAPSSLA